MVGYIGTAITNNLFSCEEIHVMDIKSKKMSTLYTKQIFCHVFYFLVTSWTQVCCGAVYSVHYVSISYLIEVWFNIPGACRESWDRSSTCTAHQLILCSSSKAGHTYEGKNNSKHFENTFQLTWRICIKRFFYRGISGPTKRTYICPPKIFKKKLHQKLAWTNSSCQTN